MYLLWRRSILEMLSGYTNAKAHRFNNNFPTIKTQNVLLLDKDLFTSWKCCNSLSKNICCVYRKSSCDIKCISAKRLVCRLRTDKLALETFVSQVCHLCEVQLGKGGVWYCLSTCFFCVLVPVLDFVNLSPLTNISLKGLEQKIQIFFHVNENES